MSEEISCPICGQYIDVSEFYKEGYNQALEEFKKELLDKKCFLFDYEKYMMIEHIAKRLKEGVNNVD